MLFFFTLLKDSFKCGGKETYFSFFGLFILMLIWILIIVLKALKTMMLDRELYKFYTDHNEANYSFFIIYYQLKLF